MKRLINSLCGTKSKKQRRDNKFRPSFQVLEDRKLMTVTASFNGASLVLTGDEMGDKVEVVDSPSGRTTSAGFLQVFVNGLRIPLNGFGSSPVIPSFSGDPSRFHNITAQLGGGNDQFNYRIVDGANTGIPFTRTPLKTFDIDLGSGDKDRADISYLNSNGEPKILDRQDVNIFVRGGNGAGSREEDLVKVALGHLQDSRVKLDVSLGNGNDQLTVHQRGNLWSNSSLELNARGEDGRDTLAVHTTSPECTIESPAYIKVNFDGGRDADTTNLNLTTKLHGKLNLNVTGGEGGLINSQRRDDTRGVITTKPGSSGSISAKFWETYGGDEGDLQDLSVALVRGTSDNQTRIDKALVDGGAGFDIAAGTPLVVKRGIEQVVGSLAADFSRVAFRAVNGQFVAAEQTGSGHLVSHSGAAGGLETFEMIRVGTERVGKTTVDVIALRASNGKFLRALNGGGGNLHVSGEQITAFEKFRVIRGGGLSPVSRGKIALQAATGHYVCAEGAGAQRLMANRTAIGAWEEFEMVRM